MRRWRRDPYLAGLAFFWGLVVAGFVAVVLGWRGAHRTDLVFAQVPPLVSGGLGGLALIVVGMGFAVVQSTNQHDADERAQTDALLDEVAAAVDALRDRQEDRDA